jgi:V8-like Glu-specific endopeptidase
VRVVAFSLILLSSIAAQAAIFGADNRHPLTETSPASKIARSTAIAVLSSNFSINKTGRIDLDNDRMTNLCKDEPMFNEPSLSYSCTGFLIAPDLLVTAGHCVYAVNSEHEELKHETKLACEAFSWLFDFQRLNSSEAETKDLNSDRLFHCKEIIYARQTQSAPFLDYALIQLDRPALGRTPFKLASQSVVVGTPVAMLGFPFGTPMKYTDSARVTLDNPLRDSFLTSLDAFEGNSGSPVFNTAREIVGILVGGTPMDNTYNDPKLDCERVNRCTENGSVCNASDSASVIKQLPGYQGVGSEVQRIQPIIDLIHSAAMTGHAAK